jgi:hypothetical protein
MNGRSHIASLTIARFDFKKICISQNKLLIDNKIIIYVKFMKDQHIWFI